MLQLLSIADASTMTGSSRLSCPRIVSGTTWCSIGQRREKGRVQQGGARHCRISVKIRRLLRKNTQTWVLSSVAFLVPWSFSLSIGARKTISKGSPWACKIVWGMFFAAGQSPARNCMHSTKPRSKNHFPGCVQSPCSLRAVNSSADPPSAEFP